MTAEEEAFLCREDEFSTIRVSNKERTAEKRAYKSKSKSNGDKSSESSKSKSTGEGSLGVALGSGAPHDDHSLDHPAADPYSRTSRTLSRAAAAGGADVSDDEDDTRVTIGDDTDTDADTDTRVTLMDEMDESNHTRGTYGYETEDDDGDETSQPISLTQTKTTSTDGDGTFISGVTEATGATAGTVPGGALVRSVLNYASDLLFLIVGAEEGASASAGSLSKPLTRNNIGDDGMDDDDDGNDTVSNH